MVGLDGCVQFGGCLVGLAVEVCHGGPDTYVSFGPEHYVGRYGHTEAERSVGTYLYVLACAYAYVAALIGDAEPVAYPGAYACIPV